MVNNSGVINSSADSSEKKLSFDAQSSSNKNLADESEVSQSNSNKKCSELESSPSSAIELDTSPHYNLTSDEPEPIELTHLNMEAAIMCLASKVKTVTGNEGREENEDTFK